MNSRGLVAATLVYASAVVLLPGCGGGGGGGSDPAPTPTVTLNITGTASAGAPIIGTVTIKDSSSPAKTKSATIEADGKYTIDVTDLTAPFAMRADGTVGGRSYSIYSAATAADANGTVNVTPLTDLIVANIAGQIAGSYYDSGTFSGMTADALNSAETALQARLQAVLTELGVADSIDLLRASFNADHTGLDAALDVLSVTVDPTTAQATIVNVINKQQIVDDLSTQTDTTTIDGTGTATGLTDFQLIVAAFDTWTGLFATSLPSASDPNLLALFDQTNFKHDGENLPTWLSNITSNPSLIGIKFGNVSLKELNPGVQATVNFTAIAGGIPEAMTFKMNYSGGTWLLAGNQRIARIDARTFARNDVNVNVGMDTGIQFEIEDAAGLGIDYAVVTGSGLPSSYGGCDGANGTAGALLVADIGNQSFTAVQSPYDGTTNNPWANSGHNQYPLLDAAIGAMNDNETYTVELYDDAGTTGSCSDDTMLVFYFVSPGKRPYFNTELSASLFATITTTSSAIQTFATAGGNLTVNWTLPANGLSNGVSFWRSTLSGLDSADANTKSTDTSAMLTIGAPSNTVVADGIDLFIKDVFNRELVTILNGQ